MSIQKSRVLRCNTKLLTQKGVFRVSELTISLKNLIAPAFYDIHRDIKIDRYTHYFFAGGRGSCKSSTISVEIVKGLETDKTAHAVCYVKYGVLIGDGVYNQIKWAIEKLGLSRNYKFTTSPHKIKHKTTGQTIFFKGLDDADKSKGIKAEFGYFKYLWFEEADLFAGIEELDKVIQSIVRAEFKTSIFYSYNPPKTANNWINTEVLKSAKDKIVHRSDYRGVPKQWLGEQFIAKAEYTKDTDEMRYKHEYLGEVTGTGGQVFSNVICKPITDDEIKSFENVYRGLDFGFSTDPSSYVVLAHHNHKLYIYYEYYACGATYDVLYDEMHKENVNNDTIIADSAEPRSIYELTQRRLKVVPVYKGKMTSIHHGIMWLQGLREIIIDSERCPNVAREFIQYEYERDRQGNFKADYPDKDNHSIDAVRYACNKIITVKQALPNSPQPTYNFESEKPKQDRIVGKELRPPIMKRR